MNKISLLPVALGVALLGVALLGGCATTKAPMNPASAKADNAAFMSGLSLPSRQLAMSCQSQLQQKLGGAVYLVASPTLQNGGDSLTTTNAAPSGPVNVVYDQVKDGQTTTGSSVCAPPSAQ